MLAKVKLALRINHSFLDTALTDNIAEARADMIRTGVPSTLANSDTNPLVTSCIITYCKYKNATKEDTERFWTSYTYQLDCLRRSTF